MNRPKTTNKKTRKPQPGRPETKRQETKHQVAPRPLSVQGAGTPGQSSAHFAPLFRPVPEQAAAILNTLPAILDDVMPLSGAHRRDLPDAVHELSALLTFERGALTRPYWSVPRLASAYLRYFLPWNLIRMIRLLPGLDLPLPKPEALLADLGSGPLTLPLALWLAFPDWRAIPLHVTAVDSSSQALDFGREIFRRLAPDSPWHIHTLRAPLHKGIRVLRGRPWLITLGNVLNELAERPGKSRDDHENDEEVESLSSRMAELAGDLAGLLEEGGAICCVEPGTRLGGLVLEHMRAGGIAAGLNPTSPCPHTGTCPLLERSGRGWCHAVMNTGDAPLWLRELARAAGLSKTALSLSHLVLRSGNVSGPKAGTARVLSDAFAVPSLGLARYACTSQGLVLIAAAGQIPQGAVVTVRDMQPLRTDARSGARVVTLNRDGAPL